MKGMSRLGTLLGLCALLITGGAKANLIVNGDFDQFGDAGAPKSWGVYQQLPGWSTVSGRGIEVGKYRHYTSSTSPGAEDNWVVELDSYANSAMQQVVDIERDGWYQFSFYYAPRTNRTDDNIIGVDISSADLLATASSRASDWLVELDQTKQTQSGWQAYSHNLWLNSGSHFVQFAALGVSNSLGGVIDQVSLVSIPEPGVIAIFLSGLLVMVWRRRFN